MRTDFFKGKVAIVTGSSQGIGKAIALELLQEGARVVLNGRDQLKLQRTAESLGPHGDLVAVTADVSQPEGAAELVQTTLQHYGRLDLLVNNAGLGMKGRLAELKPEVYPAIFMANVMGSIYPTRAALKHLRITAGSVIFISSVAGIRGLPDHSAYCSSKMALRAIAESLRIEERRAGVHVGLVYVGFTENEDEKRSLNAAGDLVPVDDRSEFSRQTPNEVATAVLRNIRTGRFLSTLSGLGWLLRSLQWVSPWLCEQILLRIYHRRKKRLKDFHKSELLKSTP